MSARDTDALQTFLEGAQLSGSVRLPVRTGRPCRSPPQVAACRHRCRDRSARRACVSPWTLKPSSIAASDMVWRVFDPFDRFLQPRECAGQSAGWRPAGDARDDRGKPARFKPCPAFAGGRRSTISDRRRLGVASPSRTDGRIEPVTAGSANVPSVVERDSSIACLRAMLVELLFDLFLIE